MRAKIKIDLKEVERLAERGLSQEQIADALGIASATLYANKRENAEVGEAIKRGRAKGIGFVANKLMDQVAGGNVTAMIFYLKARAGWREVQQTEHSGEVGFKWLSE